MGSEKMTLGGICVFRIRPFPTCHIKCPQRQHTHTSLIETIFDFQILDKISQAMNIPKYILELVNLVSFRRNSGQQHPVHLRATGFQVCLHFLNFSPTIFEIVFCCFWRVC